MASPAINPTIGGAREGYNCRLSVSRYGSLVCRVVALSTSVKVIASDEAAGRRRAFYPFVTSGSSFEMAVIHTSWSDREAFNKWVRGYMDKVAANEPIGGTVLVEVPARRFSRMCVPEGVLNYGDATGSVSYTTALSFVGSSNPLSAIGANNVSGDSYVRNARVGQATSKYFYPSGTQVAGAESLEGTIFDRTPPKPGPSAADLQPTLGGGGAGIILPGTGSSFSRRPEDNYLVGGG